MRRGWARGSGLGAGGSELGKTKRPGATVVGRAGSMSGRFSTGVLGTERRTALGVLRTAALRVRGINRRCQRVQPSALVGSVADGGHDEEIAGAGRGDIREAFGLRPVARGFLGVVQQQVDRRPAADLQRAEILLGIDPPARFGSRQLAGQIGEDDHRELEPLRLVHGHHPHAVAPLLEDRRFGGLRSLSRRCAAPRRTRGTRSRRLLRTGAPARRHAVRWRAPAHRPVAAPAQRVRAWRSAACWIVSATGM